jgi:hypothetical protein
MAPVVPLTASQPEVAPAAVPAKVPQPAEHRAWTLPLVVIAVVVIGLGVVGWYFRASLPLVGRFISPPEPIGWATIAQADTPAFAEPTRNSQVKALLPIHQRVGLLTIPERPGAEGILWSRIRFAKSNDGFVDVTRLKDLAGDTDLAQYQVVGLALHPTDSDVYLIQSDLQTLQDFIRRFPSSALLGKAKLALADRYFALARNVGSELNPGGANYQDAFNFSRTAAELYREAPPNGADRQAASRGQEEALKLVSLYDAKLNPSPVAELNASSQSIYRGQPVTLSWSAQNASKVTLEPGPGAVETQGSRVLYPTQTTKYRLVVVGTREQTESSVQVNVNIPSPAVSLNVYPNTVERGQPITLSWSADNANDVSISPDPGTVASSGSVRLYPTRSLTYQIVARGDGGTAQQQAVVTVVEPPPVVTIAAGTQITVRLADNLDSGQSQQGQTFRATLDQPLFAGGQQVIPKYAEVMGRVVSVRPSGRTSGVAELAIVLYQVAVGNMQYPISTDPINMKAATEHGKDAAKIAGGAALGALIGAIAGGGKGAAAGAAAGGGAGTGVVLATKGKEIHLAPEALLSFRLNQSLTVRQ